MKNGRFDWDGKGVEKFFLAFGGYYKDSLEEVASHDEVKKPVMGIGSDIVEKSVGVVDSQKNEKSFSYRGEKKSVLGNSNSVVEKQVGVVDSQKNEKSFFFFVEKKSVMGNANSVVEKQNNNIDLKNFTIEDVKRYVMEHTSGVRYDYDMMSMGKIIVSFLDFVNMVNDGYNIVNSEVLNRDMISIEFQKICKKGRFK